MENGNELERLEQFVDKLLMKYNTLKKEYTDLESTFWELQGDFDNLAAEVKELRAEKSVIGERVTGLLGRIELWESQQNNPQEQERPHTEGSYEQPSEATVSGHNSQGGESGTFGTEQHHN